MAVLVLFHFGIKQDGREYACNTLVLAKRNKGLKNLPEFNPKKCIVSYSMSVINTSVMFNEVINSYYLFLLTQTVHQQIWQRKNSESEGIACLRADQLLFHAGAFLSKKR